MRILLASALLLVVACNADVLLGTRLMDGVAPTSPSEDAGASPAPPASSTPPPGAPGCGPLRGDCNKNAADGCETDLAITRTSCGACGHDCGEGLCAGGVCQPAILVSNVAAPGYLTLDATHLYWGVMSGGPDAPKPIQRLPKTGGAVQNVSGGGPGRVAGLVVDSAFAFWLMNPVGYTAILRAKKDGTSATAEQVVAFPSGPSNGLVSDGVSLFYGNGLEIDVASRTGLLAPQKKLADSPGANVTGLGIFGGLVFVADESGGFETALAPSGVRTPLPAIAPQATGVVATSTHVYFAANDVIGRMSRGGIVQTLASGLDGAHELAVDDTRVWFMTRSALMSVPLAGGAPIAVVSGLVEGGYVATDAAFVYFTSLQGAGTAGIYKIAK